MFREGQFPICPIDMTCAEQYERYNDLMYTSDYFDPDLDEDSNAYDVCFEEKRLVDQYNYDLSQPQTPINNYAVIGGRNMYLPKVALTYNKILPSLSSHPISFIVNLYDAVAAYEPRDKPPSKQTDEYQSDFLYSRLKCVINPIRKSYQSNDRQKKWQQKEDPNMTMSRIQFQTAKMKKIYDILSYDNKNIKLRKNHIQSLMYFDIVGHLYSVTVYNRNSYQVLFTTKNGDMKIIICLSDEFPTIQPHLYCNKTYRHRLILRNGRIIHRWTHSSDLGDIVQDLVRQFKAAPPPIVNNQNGDIVIIDDDIFDPRKHGFIFSRSSKNMILDDIHVPNRYLLPTVQISPFTKLEYTFHSRGVENTVSLMQQCIGKPLLNNFANSLNSINYGICNWQQGIAHTVAYYLIRAIPAVSECRRLFDAAKLRNNDGTLLNINQLIIDRLYEGKYSYIYNLLHNRIPQGKTWVDIWNATGLIPRNIKSEIRNDYNERYGHYFRSGTWFDLLSLLNDLILYWPNHQQNVVELIVNIFMSDETFSNLYLFIIRSVDILDKLGKTLTTKFRSNYCEGLGFIMETQRILGNLKQETLLIQPVIDDLVLHSKSFKIVQDGSKYIKFI